MQAHELKRLLARGPFECLDVEFWGRGWGPKNHGEYVSRFNVKGREIAISFPTPTPTPPNAPPLAVAEEIEKQVLRFISDERSKQEPEALR